MKKKKSTKREIDKIEDIAADRLANILVQQIDHGKIKKVSPAYDLDKIKFATDAATFEKAVELYESGKVTQFEGGINAYSAVVLGTKPYRVAVEARRYDYGHIV